MLNLKPLLNHKKMLSAFSSFLLCFLFLKPVYIHAAPLDTILEKMAAVEADLKSVEFLFTQENHITVTDETQVQSGKASFIRPGRFRIDFWRPEKQIVVSDGQVLWFYHKARNQVFIDDWDRWAESSGFPKGLTPFQLPVSDLKARYNIEWVKETKVNNQPVALLELTPKEETMWAYQFRLWVDTKEGLPIKTELRTKSIVATTTIEKMKQNPDLKDDLFLFTVPAEAKVFDSRGEGQ